MQTQSAANTRLARLEQYLEADPRNGQLLADLIESALEAGELHLARSRSEQALDLDPQDAQVRYRHGTVLLAQGLWTEAETLFAALLQDTPDENVAYGLAHARFGQGRHEEALAALAGHEGSGAPHAVTLRVRCLHHMRKLEEAIEVARRHMASCGADPEFLAAFSLALLDGDRLQEAGRLSAAALSGSRRPLAALVAAGTVALGRNDPAAAGALFEEAVHASPQDGRAWGGLGMTSMLKNELPVATDQLRRAAALLPTHIGTLHALGWCHLVGGDLEAAGTAFDKALQLDRNFAETHGGLAAIAARRGDRMAAEESIARALRLDAKCLSAQYARMALDGQLDDPSRFRRVAMAVLAKRPAPFGGSMTDFISPVQA